MHLLFEGAQVAALTCKCPKGRKNIFDSNAMVNLLCVIHFILVVDFKMNNSNLFIYSFIGE